MKYPIYIFTAQILFLLSISEMHGKEYLTVFTDSLVHSIVLIVILVYLCTSY